MRASLPPLAVTTSLGRRCPVYAIPKFSGLQVEFSGWQVGVSAWGANSDQSRPPRACCAGLTEWNPVEFRVERDIGPEWRRTRARIRVKRDFDGVEG